MMGADLHIWLVLAMLVIFPAIASRDIFMPALFVFSFLVILLPVRYGAGRWALLLAGICLLVLAVAVAVARRKSVFSIDTKIELKWWRIFARPFALLFIPINIYLGNRFLLYLLGILAIIFICTDLFRLFSRRPLSLFFKKTEIQRFSSMTSFLVAVFIVFLLFPPEVAYLCLGFIIFGDIVAKFTGIKYGRIKIIHDRTLEGSLGFLTGCIYIGFILCSIYDIGFGHLLFGSLCATLAELLSFNMDDNFTVGILTGGCLMALRYFQVI
jgi:dolichol kinase